MEYLLSTLTSALFCVLLFLLWKPRQSSIKTAPKAPGAWPIIGHLHLVGGSKLPHMSLGSMVEKLGPIFTIKFGMKPALVVSSWELAKECLTTNDKALANRPKSIAVEVVGYNYAFLGLTFYGPYWRHLRKVAMLELLSLRRIEMLGDIRRSEVKTCIKEVYDQWATNKTTTGSDLMLLDLKGWLKDTIHNIIVRMLAGKRCSGRDDKEGVEFQKVIREFFEFVGLFLLSDALPFLRWLDLGGSEKAMKKTARELDITLESWLNEHKQKRIAGLVEPTKQDFMDVMLSIFTPEACVPGGYDSDTIIKSMCEVVLAGGTDTTSITLTWALSLLLNNPHELKKAQDELDMHVGRERQIEESDLKNLVYLQAILKESMRLYPAAPLAAPHESMEDCTINGYHVAKGTRIVFNVWKIQRDPRVWPDPLEFKPERFLTTHKDVDFRGQHYEFLPFGSGRRMCPGLNLAIHLASLTLASFLHAFDFKTVLNEPVDMAESFGLTNLKATPLDVLVTSRLPSNLYG